LGVSGSVFAWGRRASAFAAISAAIAMFVYPGGTYRDHSTSGYQFFHNFLSDLGATVAFDGQPNRVGAALFVASLVVLVVGLGGTMVGLVRLYARSPSARGLSLAAGAIGLLVCACFIGVAVTPENRLRSLHIVFTKTAFRAFPGVPLFLGLASRRVTDVPRRATFAWLAMIAVLVTYVLILDWGPRVTTPYGLVVQVSAQKLVAVGAVLLIVYQGRIADRLLGRQTD
jgi:hypothetical membrane protein